jgi:hypothetical protein
MTPINKDNMRFSIKLIAVAALILGARLWFIKASGVSVSLPYFDEWEVGFYTLLPWLNSQLSLFDLFTPYGEHSIVLSRLLTLLLTVLNDTQWDPLLETVVNAFIYTITVVILAIILRKLLGTAMENWVLLSITLLGAIPFGWINIIWGFQSAWYLLLFFTLLTFWGLLLHQNFTWQWWTGMVCGILAFLNLASGFFTLLIALAVKLYLMKVRGEKVTHHLPLLRITLLLTAISVLQLLNAPKHTELYSKDPCHFFLALGKFIAWPWVDYPILSLLIYLPFLALVVRIWRLQRQPSKGELLLIAIGGWVILQAVAMAIARGAGDGVHSISRYWEIMSLGILVNLFSLTFLTQPWYELSPRIRQHLNVLTHAWGILVVVGIYTLMIQAIPEITVKRLTSKDQLNNVRTFLRTGDFKVIKSYPAAPYPAPELLADYLKRPKFQSLLPSSLATPAVVPVNREEETPTFVKNGIYPSTKTRGEEMLGSFNNMKGNAATGRFESARISPPSQTFTEIPVSGYLGEKGMSLSLVVEGSNKPIELTPYKVVREGLIPIYVRTPEKPFRIVAVDNNPELWFAFAAPRGIGKLSVYSQWLLRYGQTIFTFGALLMALMLNPKVFNSLTRSE